MNSLYAAAATAAAAKSLQSCPTLCDPIDGGPPGSPVPEILQARTLEWVAISFSNVWKGKVEVKPLSRVRLFATPWSAAHQAPPSMGFSRQEYWSGVPLSSPNIAVYKHGSWDSHGIESGKKTVQGDKPWDLTSIFFLASDSSASPVISCLIVSNPGMPGALIFVRGSWFLLLLIRYVFLPFPEKHTETWQVFIDKGQKVWT